MMVVSVRMNGHLRRFMPDNASTMADG